MASQFSVNDRFQQADELALSHARLVSNTVQVVKWLIQNSRRRICHAGDAQNAYNRYAAPQSLPDRGHADKIGADCAHVAYLRRRLIARP